MSDYNELVADLREADQPNWKRLSLDAAAAIEALQAEQKKTVTQIFCEEQAAWEGRCKDLMKIISELQAEVNGLIADAGARIGKVEAERPHWVSVKDELPEIDKRVLVSYGGWIQIMSRRDDGDKICEKYWEDEEGLWERVMDDSYWMPLPEPPQEVQDGPIITPCRGCSDYDGYGGCKSKGGCARAKKEVQE